MNLPSLCRFLKPELSLRSTKQHLQRSDYDYVSISWRFVDSSEASMTKAEALDPEFFEMKHDRAIPVLQRFLSNS
jgi:hypothetical protein